MTDDNTQLVCDVILCKCSESEEECACVKNDSGSACRECEAPLVRIDFHTGEIIGSISENADRLFVMENEVEQSAQSTENLTDSLEIFQEAIEQSLERLPTIYGLVDLSKGVKGTTFLKVGEILPITRWRQLYELKGKETQRFECISFTLEQLQYLYWNTVKKAPPVDDRDGLEKACGELITGLHIDTTPVEEIEAEIQKLKPIPEPVIEITDTTEEGEIMSTKKGTLLKPSQAKATKAAKPKAEKAVKEPKPAKAAKEKKSKAEVANLKVGDVFVGKFKGVDYEVSAVDTAEGVQFKLKGGKTFATKSAAAKALWEKLELPAEGLKTFRFRGPVEKSVT